MDIRKIAHTSLQDVTLNVDLVRGWEKYRALHISGREASQKRGIKLDSAARDSQTRVLAFFPQSVNLLLQAQSLDMVLQGSRF